MIILTTLRYICHLCITITGRCPAPLALSIALITLGGWVIIRFPRLICATIWRLSWKIICVSAEAVFLMMVVGVAGTAGMKMILEIYSDPAWLQANDLLVIDYTFIPAVADLQFETWIIIGLAIISFILGLQVFKASRWYSSPSGSEAGKQQMPSYIQTHTEHLNTSTPYWSGTAERLSQESSLPKITTHVPPIIVQTAAAQPIDKALERLLPLGDQFRTLEERMSQLLETVQCLADELNARPTTDMLLTILDDRDEENQPNMATNHNKVPLVCAVSTEAEIIDINSDEDTPMTPVLRKTISKTEAVELPGCVDRVAADSQRRRNSLDCVEEGMLREYIGLNKESFFQRVAEQAKTFRQARRPPQNLTTEEKTLGQRSLCELDLSWRQQSGLPIKLSHREPIGTLTFDEAQFSRSAIKEIICSRRHHNWVERMKARGIPLIVCPNCSLTVTDQHRCLTTSWGRRVQRGPISGRAELLVTQQGKGAVKLQQQYRADQEQLERNLRQLKEKQHILREQQQQAAANLPYHDLTNNVPSANLQPQETTIGTAPVSTSNPSYINSIVTPAPIDTYVTGYPVIEQNFWVPPVPHIGT